MSQFITKRRLVSLASASAMIATMAMAAAPAATLATTCTPTGFVRDGINLTAAQMGGPVTGELDATTCDIGVYNPTSVANADIHGARYYGVVVNGHSNVSLTGSKVHQIGESPFDGTQHGNAILYIDGASGTISDNQVYDFQKNGIVVSGQSADGTGLSSGTTSATIRKNVVIGQGHIGYIAQNGIVIRNGATATVTDNTISKVWYVDPAGSVDDTTATGLLNYNADEIIASGNRFVDTEVTVEGDIVVPAEVTTTVANVRGSSTTVTGPRGVRVDFRSQAQPANTTLGNKLDWKIKVDGRLAFHVKEGFGAHDVYAKQFRAGSGRHVIKVLKNDVLVRTAIVRA